MTPFEIRVLLHYFTSRDHEPEESKAPIFPATMQQFINDELLTRDADGFGHITDRGKAYCEALQLVPLPVQKWVMP